MSSNMYGFSIEFDWKGRVGFAQIVFVGTYEDEPDSLYRVLKDFGTDDPVELAKYELTNRDFSTPNSEKRLSVWHKFMYHLDNDPNYLEWKPPIPSDKQLLEIIASNEFSDYIHGWDT